MDHAERTSLNELTEQVIGGALQVSNVLGCGYLEKVYENALAIELRRRGLKVRQQAGLAVTYLEEVVGEYSVDLLVENRMIVELKVARELVQVHEAQCLNYLRASGLTACLLLNFSRPRLGIRRFISG